MGIRLEVKDRAQKIVEAISDVLSDVNGGEVERLASTILRTLGDRKIFVVGAGRTGLVAKAFVMRLMHLGFSVHVVGETITPRMDPGDLLIAISGSGETLYPLTIARQAKKLGGILAVITSYPESTLGKMADVRVVIKGRVLPAAQADYDSRQIMGLHEPLTPLGTLFEISTLVFCDALISELASRLGKTEEDLARRHATLE
ncbi:MAG TPA: 6-phospho-3-hexuloisomerase [Candidatus Korarchaeota archaeon]|nr:6-phospho-3-hexuloisomerase [Candidatus Korarchaeota archaeon]